MYQLINSEGLLLKSDKPSTAIDATWSYRSPQGHVYNSHTEIHGFLWFFVIGAELEEEFMLETSDLYPFVESGVEYVGFNWHNPAILVQFSNGIPYKLPENDPTVKWDFTYHIFAPILDNGFIILGETNKFVTISNLRITKIESESQTFVKIHISGGKQEVITVIFFESFEKL